MSRAHPLPASRGWRTTSQSCPVLSPHTPAEDRLCGWAQPGETAPVSTPAEPQIQPEPQSNIILWVFWVRDICITYPSKCMRKKYELKTSFVFFWSVPPQIEGDTVSLKFGGQGEKVRINGSLTLSCLAKGFPEPKVNWFKDGQVGVSSFTTSAFLEMIKVVISLYWQPLRIATASIELTFTCRSHRYPRGFCATREPVHSDKDIEEESSGLNITT